VIHRGGWDINGIEVIDTMEINNVGGYETENPGAQENYDKFIMICDELMKLESDLKDADEKMVSLFGDERKKTYDLAPCARRVARIIHSIDDDAIGFPRAKGLYLMSYDEQRHIF